MMWSGTGYFFEEDYGDYKSDYGDYLNDELRRFLKRLPPAVPISYRDKTRGSFRDSDYLNDEFQ